MKFLIGVIIVVVGALMTAKANKFLTFFGRIEFFETRFGTTGGSRFGYQVIGIILIFLGIITMTGLIGGFMGWALSPLLQYQK